MFLKSITKEQINLLPVKTYEGPIHLIDNPEDVAKATDYLKHQKVLGFDTETKPAFKKGQKHDVALLQLVAENDAFLFRLNKVGIPKELQAILARKEIIKVGAAIKDDLKALNRHECMPPAGFVDLQNLVRTYGIESVSLQKMTAIVLNFKISKRQQVSNWEASQLTNAQLRYAATDGWVGLKIFTTLRNRLGDRFHYVLHSANSTQ